MLFRSHAQGESTAEQNESTDTNEEQTEFSLAPLVLCLNVMDRKVEGVSDMAAFQRIYCTTIIYLLYSCIYSLIHSLVL